MTLSPEQLEWIVAEVVRRLTAAGVARAPTRERWSCEANHGTVSEDLAIADKVVTLRSIEGRLVGVKRLVVQPRVVITPAVKDELKQRNIELVFLADKNVCPT
jgi:hypothetical protein